MDERYQLHSTIVASQPPIEHWHVTMADPTVADAILARLVYKTHKIFLKKEFTWKILSACRGVETRFVSPTAAQVGVVEFTGITGRFRMERLVDFDSIEWLI